MNSFIRYGIVFYILISLISCTTIRFETSGGMGKKAGHVKYIYTPQNLNLQKYYKNNIFKISVKKYDRNSPVEPDLSYIKKALTSEIENAGGKVATSDDDVADVLLQAVVSKYVTRKFNDYMTYIDFEISWYDRIDGKQIDAQVYSISGSGSTPNMANTNAINKFVKYTLADGKLLNYLSTITSSGGSRVSHLLDKLAQSLLKNFEQKKQYSTTQRIAFVGFENDADGVFTNNFVSSLKRFWTYPKYQIYTRAHLEKIIKEQSLQLSGVLDGTTILEPGKLKGVNFIITGNVSVYSGSKLIEAQIINVADGEIVASSNGSFKVEGK